MNRDWFVYGGKKSCSDWRARNSTMQSQQGLARSKNRYGANMAILILTVRHDNLNPEGLVLKLYLSVLASNSIGEKCLFEKHLA